MSAPVRLAAFALALLLVFGAAFGAGAAVGPFDGDDPPPSGPPPTWSHGDHP